MLQAAHRLDPRQSPHGFFSCTDQPWGIGMFHWFDSTEQMVHALTNVLPAALMEPAEAQIVDELVAKLSAIVEKHPSDARVDEACVSELRAALRGIQDISWVGTFELLCCSDAEFARRVRADFRASQAPEAGMEPERPIDTNEVDMFADFIGGYGY
jgi:hypothetical protein